jgi:hypothetical protein
VSYPDDIVVLVDDDPDSPTYGTVQRMTQAELDHVNEVLSNTIGRMGRQP